jgi:microcystin-dependent protein
MGSGWLTPNTLPPDVTCRALFIPNDEQFIANVRGLLQTFTFPESFDQYGSLTPDQTADAYVPMFDAFCFQEGPCRMIGEIVTYAGASSPKPTLWLECDGSSLLRSDYPDLFVVIGTIYGATDGSHFNLPDLRGRVVVDAGSGPGLTPRAVGDNGGEETHQLTVMELASHSHTDAGHVHSEGNALPAVGAAIVGVPIPSAVPSVGVTGSASANIVASGNDVPHNTMQPFLSLLYLIVALPGG